MQAPKLLNDTFTLAPGQVSDKYDVSAIDMFYAAVVGDAVIATFYRPAVANNTYQGETAELTISNGRSITLDDGEMSAWGAVDFRLASGGASSSIETIVNFRGRA